MTDQHHHHEALDAELAHRIDAESRMTTALVELENHPGHRLLSTGTSTGRTAERWACARDILARLRQDFETYQAVLAAALRERRLTGSADQVETITLDQLSARMGAAFGDVSEVLVTCDALHQAYLAGLPPLAERVLAVRELARDLVSDAGDPVVAAVTRLTARIDDLGRACATDPLSLAGRPPAAVLAELDAEITATSARLAELAAVQNSWDDPCGALRAVRGGRV